MENKRPVFERISQWITNVFEFVFALLFTVVFMTAFLGVAAVVNAFVRGVVIVFIWSWFVSPIFSIRGISLGEAVGLSMVVYALRPSPTTQNEGAKSAYAQKHPVIDGTMKATASVFLAPAFLLFLAWVWHSYCMNLTIPEWLDFIQR
jgi:hypothetical protein